MGRKNLMLDFSQSGQRPILGVMGVFVLKRTTKAVYFEAWLIYTRMIIC